MCPRLCARCETCHHGHRVSVLDRVRSLAALRAVRPGRYPDGAPVDVLRPAEERRAPRSRFSVREAASDAPPTGGQTLHHGLWLTDGGANGSPRPRCLLRGAPLCRGAECHSHRLAFYAHRTPARSTIIGSTHTDTESRPDSRPLSRSMHTIPQGGEIVYESRLSPGRGR